MGGILIHPRIAPVLLPASEQRLLLTACRAEPTRNFPMSWHLAFRRQKDLALDYERSLPTCRPFLPTMSLRGTNERGKEKKQRLLGLPTRAFRELRPAAP